MTSNAIRLSSLVAPIFSDVHRAIKHHQYTHYWLKGGRASTKSSYVSIEIVQGIMRTPGANAIVYRKVANTLRNSVVSQCRWAIHMLGVDDLWQINKSTFTLTYRPTGQAIYFSGADDPEKSKGIKLESGYFAYIWFEELSEFNCLDDIETINRSIIRGAGQTAAIYTYNPPKSVNNWVNAESLLPRADRLVHHSTYLDVPPEWLGEQFIKEAAAVKECNLLKYRWAYLGEATGTGGAVFDNVQIRKITYEERANIGKLYDGLDVGYAVDPNAYVVLDYNPALRRVMNLDEFYAQHASYDRLADEIKKRNDGRYVTVDSADGGRSVDELIDRGIRAIGARKGPGSVDHGLHWLQDLDAIIIDPDTCPNTAREFAGYEYEQDRWGNFKAAYPDRDNHSIDAVRYALETVILSGVKPVTTRRLY